MFCSTAELPTHAGAQEGQAGTISPMGRGHSPDTQHQAIPYTPIYLPSPLVRSCPRAMGAQAPPQVQQQDW